MLEYVEGDDKGDDEAGDNEVGAAVEPDEQVETDDEEILVAADESDTVAEEDVFDELRALVLNAMAPDRAISLAEFAGKGSAVIVT